MPLSISLRHEDARASKRYRLSEDQFKKIALYDGLVQDDDILWYISNVSAGATMSFYGVSHKDHPWMLDDIKWLPLVMD